MAQDLSSVDTHFIVRELQELVSSKVEKVYQDGNLFFFKLFTRKGKQKLRIIIPGIINITSKEHSFPMALQGFSAFLRKYLTNTIINKVYQKDFERIIIFEFDTKEHGELSLIIELFKPGNMMLCKKDGIIINPLTRKSFKDRKVAAREKYEFPPPQDNIKDASPDEILKVQKQSGMSIVKTLAMRFGLGGIYSEEVLERAGVQKDKTEISDEDAKKIFLSVKELLNEEIKPFSIDGKIYPVSMKSMVSKEAEFSCFSEAIDSIDLEAKQEKQEKKKPLSDVQEKRILELEKEIVENQKTGEFIYENYQEFSKLLSYVKEMRKTKHLKEINEALKQNKHFKELNEKEKKIILEF